jgi:hypothetical protein
MAFTLPLNLLTLRAQNASITSLVPVDRKDLVELLLDDNALDPALQTQTFVTLPRSLQIFSCQRCGLQLDVAMIFRALGGPGSRVAVVGLAMNEIMGTLPSSCFAWTALEELGASNAVQLSTPTWPLTLQLLDLSGNRGCQCAHGTTSCAISAVFIWLLLTCYGAFVPLSSDQ